MGQVLLSQRDLRSDNGFDRSTAGLSGVRKHGCAGLRFEVLQFDPDVDRFEVACWRESNFPTLLDVEAGGTTMDGVAATALWNANADTLKSINFGNVTSVCSTSPKVAATSPSRTASSEPAFIGELTISFVLMSTILVSSNR